MPDWKRLVEKRLAPSRLTPEVQREVVAEIAEHLEDCHDELQKAGRSDPQGETLAQVSDWTGLCRDIRRAKEDPMNVVRTVLMPGVAGVIVALGALRLFTALLVAPQPCAMEADCQLVMVSADGPAYLPWLASLLVTGALVAGLARRLGARPGQRLVAAVFPAIYLAVETTVMGLLDSFFWRIPIYWVFVPAIVCAIGAWPFLRGRGGSIGTQPVMTAQNTPTAVVSRRHGSSRNPTRPTGRLSCA